MSLGAYRKINSLPVCEDEQQCGDVHRLNQVEDL